MVPFRQVKGCDLPGKLAVADSPFFPSIYSKSLKFAAKTYQRVLSSNRAMRGRKNRWAKNWITKICWMHGSSTTPLGEDSPPKWPGRGRMASLKYQLELTWKYQPRSVTAFANSISIMTWTRDTADAYNRTTHGYTQEHLDRLHKLSDKYHEALAHQVISM